MAKSILVVDDSKTIRMVVKKLLADAGYHVDVAINGAEALEYVKKQSFDFILTDIAMPKMDGYAFIRELLSMGRESPPLILMSEHDKPIIETAVQLANSYGLRLLGSVCKPIDRNQLLDTLKAVSSESARPQDSTATLLSETAFMTGLKTGALISAFQPIVDLFTGSIYGFECLARWRTPQGGILGPSTFLPVAVRKGYLPIVTEMILTRVLKQVSEWNKQGFRSHVAVNVSVLDVSSLEFADFVKEQLNQHDVLPDQLTLELTESEFANREQITLEVLGRLRLLGVNLALDDFGAGFDPFIRLKKLPFTALKVDRLFVQEASENETASAVLEMTIKLANRLKLRCTCEGIETENQWSHVRMLGATQAQGFYICPPMLPDKVLDWCKQWDPTNLLK